MSIKAAGRNGSQSSLNELKEVNRILTEISKTADHLNKADLTDMESSAFSTAGKYGQKASQYLTGVQEMALAGYGNAEKLSDAYTSLDAWDPRRVNLIDAVGGKDSGNQLRALLENCTLYEKMLKDYASGSGSAMEMAMSSADSWEGSLNRLNNTFTKVVHNFVNSDFVVAVTNGFNGVLSVVDKITSKLGSFGSMGVGAGLFAGLKNVGRAKC